MKALDNRFYVKFMQFEIGLLGICFQSCQRFHSRTFSAKGFKVTRNGSNISSTFEPSRENSTQLDSMTTIQGLYGRKSDSQAKVIPKIRQTGPLIMYCTKPIVLLYYVLHH